MRKDTGQDSKVGIGIHAFDSGRGRLKWPPRVGELFWGKVKKKKQTCGETHRSILQLLLLIKCHLFECARLKVTLLIENYKKINKIKNSM